ncbi:Proline racemase [Roseovarius sp. THAF27]|uniref:proline racemase family protein n=1 Tax=Roseovarius sp. THAF27 TaxID=2587850 RepID=UPI0012AA562E|nr:proline racemase family protein [Roseovarius sp. THAF27]QFT81983.1 Proline racemase [Roseovarius sp. THAF27]
MNTSVNLIGQYPATLDVVDVHVGGDLHRIVLGGVAALPGSTVLDQMKYLRTNADGLRQLLLHEPRGGHPSIFADLVVPAVHPSAAAGFIIMERMGYPLISGTNTMSTVIALIEMGRIPVQDGPNRIILEAPGGLIEVAVTTRAGRVREVTYEAQTPSYVAERDLKIELPEWGTVSFDLAWTGAFYPIVNADALGFSLNREDEDELVRFAKAFIAEARKTCRPVHPEFGDEEPLSFLIFAGQVETGSDGCHERKLCCYEYPLSSVCRCPAGVPSTAAIAQSVDRGELSAGDTLRTISIFGTELRVAVTEFTEYHGHQGVKAAVTGSGWITMHSRLLIDFDDPLTPGDGLRELVLMSGVSLSNAQGEAWVRESD